MWGFPSSSLGSDGRGDFGGGVPLTGRLSRFDFPLLLNTHYIGVNEPLVGTKLPIDSV